MDSLVGCTSRHFARALVMPNVPAVHDGIEADEYRARIMNAPGVDPRRFQVLPTIKLTHRTSPGMVREAKEYGVISAKLYPSGVTTASHDGIRDVTTLVPVFRAMQDCGMVLCVHGEEPGAFVLDRERDYLPRVAWIVKHFPGLKVVLEHITTEAAVKFVCEASVNVAATITAHHLDSTLDDVLGQGGIRPHNFCYPIPKMIDDRNALIQAVLYFNDGKLMFGSDSAPHLRGAKESACGCAGVFSAPVALSILAHRFLWEGLISSVPYRLSKDRIRALERFTSEFGAEFYGLPLNEGTITLVDEPWTVPDEISGVVPWRAGETLAWKILGDGDED